MGFFAKRPQPQPDTNVMEKATIKAQKERDTVKVKNQAKIRNARNRARGRSMLAFAQTGLTGVKDTLG